jgi:hypothetical protein
LLALLAYAVDEAWPFDPAGIHATPRDRRAGTGAAVSGGVNAWNGAIRTLCPDAAREAVTDNLLGPPHDAHADHERHGGGQEAL